MKKKNIIELVKELELEDLGKDLVGYSDSYIDDAFTEIADYNTSIYYSEQKKFLIENTEWVERAIEEFGWDGCGSDLYKASAMGEYLKILYSLQDNMEDIIKYYAYNYLMHSYKMYEIDENFIDAIDELASNLDGGNYVSDISEAIDLYLKGDENDLFKG